MEAQTQRRAQTPQKAAKELITFPFWLSPQFRAGKIPFLGLAFLPNTTETLAAQATESDENI